MGALPGHDFCKQSRQSRDWSHAPSIAIQRVCGLARPQHTRGRISKVLARLYPPHHHSPGIWQSQIYLFPFVIPSLLSSVFAPCCFSHLFLVSIFQFNFPIFSIFLLPLSFTSCFALPCPPFLFHSVFPYLFPVSVPPLFSLVYSPIFSLVFFPYLFPVSVSPLFSLIFFPCLSPYLFVLLFFLFSLYLFSLCVPSSFSLTFSLFCFFLFSLSDPFSLLFFLIRSATSICLFSQVCFLDMFLFFFSFLSLLFL